MGYGIMEQIMTDDGGVLNANLGDYKIPNIKDIPQLKLPSSNPIPAAVRITV
jgi:CO/xanthine dehydrogenase Mo-binding subunit